MHHARIPVASQHKYLTLSRLLIGMVLFINLQCAAVFLLWPQRYAGSFELSGAVGQAMVQALGVLFLMWNVPYAVAFWHPLRHRLALREAIAMQSIGLAGESLILASLPALNAALRHDITRFVLFDGLGLLVLLAALWLVRRVPAEP